MTLRKALFITATDRVNYFENAIKTWKKVRGFYDWHVVIRFEPNPRLEAQVKMVKELGHPNLEVIVNPEVYGVLHHPWVGFEELFKDFDFVVRGEDDLLVSDDILEYFEWAAEEYAEDKDIAIILGYSDWEGPENEVQRIPSFNPLTWGTWRNRWRDFIGPTWDHDYSTNNGTPGVHAGWDWNLNTRILPSLGLSCIFPIASRVQNIGVFGTHSLPENFRQTTSFVLHREPVDYFEREGR